MDETQVRRNLKTMCEMIVRRAQLIPDAPEGNLFAASWELHLTRDELTAIKWMLEQVKTDSTPPGHDDPSDEERRS